MFMTMTWMALLPSLILYISIELLQQLQII